MSENKKNEIDRRAFLQRLMTGVGAFSIFPGDIFLNNILMQFLQKGHAQAAGQGDGLGDMKLINLSIGGGISRWYWDSILTPNGSSDVFVPNPMVITRFRAQGDQVVGEYATTRVGSYNLPWTWAAQIPTADGGSVPMTSLAHNMLSLRGINTLIDSHGINRQRHVALFPGGTSITGLLADKAKTPIPVVHSGVDTSYYGSQKGTGLVSVGGGNPFSTALAPFLPTNNITGIKSTQVEDAIDLALAKMNAASVDKHKYLPSTYQARANAKTLMRRQFGNLQQSYSTLVNKYTNLMRRSSSKTDSALILAGVDDLSIPVSRTAPFNIGGNGNFYSASTDAQNFVGETAVVGGMANAMAVAEFMIKENLSSAFTFGLGGLVANNDAHEVGSHLALLNFSRYYRAFSAALYEFIQQMKAISTPHGNMFNQTAIAVTSEFNRNPRSSGTGADHGWRGANYTVFSGMVNQLTVLGNVRSDSSNNYLGTWGLSAPMSELGGREAILGNCLSTISAMVDVKTPMPNDRSFVRKQNGSIVPVMTSCQNFNANGTT